MVKLVLGRLVIRVQTTKTGIEKTKEYVSGIIYVRHYNMGKDFYVIFPIRMAYQINHEIYVCTGKKSNPIRVN